MDNPIISVVMPVYNAARFLPQAIESILNQTFTRFEFIIINDGSADNSADIIKSFADPRIKLINNKANKGLVYSLNKGVSIAQGKYIARMDADDIAYPQRFETQFNYLIAHPNIKLLGCQVNLIDDNNKIFSNWAYPTTIQQAKEDIKTSCCFAHPTVMFDKEVFDKVGRYNAGYKIAGEDYDLWQRILKEHDGVNLPDTLLNYRIHSNSFSSANLANQILVCKAIDIGIDPGDEISPEVLMKHGLGKTEIANTLQNGFLFWADIYKKMGNYSMTNKLLADAGNWLYKLGGRSRPLLERYSIKYFLKTGQFLMLPRVLINFLLF